ncbi:hypothetical protein [Vibrio metschnikovii]|uniref:hypothetical protein n=1 Tax=Vibrio metschnikovii TaxID=28172 RepID=UPI001644B2DB|nr:hypothetical protein [Vibrio metschnikovii]MBC3621547.1 hypothetical protein [Vibrio metschnikovii]
MFRDFDLTFTEECSQYLKKIYPKHKVILEYGSGGSTLLAAENGSLVITTETDSKWLIELMGVFQEKKLAGTIIPILVDIGPTKAWGYPVDDREIKNWLGYSNSSWSYLNTHDLHPSLILIDGRFRVASFFSACANVRKTTTIIFDDYVEREYYHIVEKLFSPIQIIDNRMAVFKVKPNKVTASFILDNINFFLDTR